VPAVSFSVESLPTVAEVLLTPALARGKPVVLAGAMSLDRRVRWVHVSELPDIAGLLPGGELILTTGIGLPRDAAALREYVEGLAHSNAAGLVIELGRRFDELPEALISAAERTRLPLVSLQRVVRFVDVTKEVHVRILSDQLEMLQASEHAHRVFTNLGLQGASPAGIVAEVASLIDSPVVFENLVHQVMAYDSRRSSPDELLRDWESRSRAVASGNRTAQSASSGFLITNVAIRGETFGRLIALPDGDATPLQVMIVERGATALVLNRLVEHNRESMERQAHRSTLIDLIDQRFTSERDMSARAAAVGVPTDGRDLVAVIVDISADSRTKTLKDNGLEHVAAAVRSAKAAALIGTLRPGRIAVLVTLGPRQRRTAALEALATALHDRFPTERGAIIAAASTVSDLLSVAAAFTEAQQIADAARGSRQRKAYFELPDIELRGLLYVLGSDARVQSFVERSLGPLLRYDDRHGTDLCDALNSFLSHSGNKAAAAASSGMSRQAFYRRLDTAERILAVDLSSAETRTSLHAAALALDSLRAAN
jgi:purine catabolism regulator